MRLTVNGIDQELSSPPLALLLSVLREELEITSPKAGCQQGGCGTCTVLVDGQPRRSCLTPLAAVDGASITTLEGLGEPEQMSTVQAAFYTRYAAQCGFCTPGMIGAATAPIDRAGGERTEALEDFLNGSRDGRLVLSVEYGAGDLRTGAATLRRRHAHSYSIANVAVCEHADGLRVAVSGVVSPARRCPSVESSRNPDDVLRDVDLVDDALATAAYRREILPVLVRRALDELETA